MVCPSSWSALAFGLPLMAALAHGRKCTSSQLSPYSHPPLQKPTRLPCPGLPSDPTRRAPSRLGCRREAAVARWCLAKVPGPTAFHPNPNPNQARERQEAKQSVQQALVAVEFGQLAGSLAERQQLRAAIVRAQAAGVAADEIARAEGVEQLTVGPPVDTRLSMAPQLGLLSRMPGPELLSAPKPSASAPAPASASTSASAPASASAQP